MEKNWLIRTKNLHILGPVSKKKLMDLFQTGSIRKDDEVCSGNGYWFSISEIDLVDKYLRGATAQGFNPVSEAKTILTSDHKVDLKEVKPQSDGEDFIPSQDDLEYPDMDVAAGPSPTPAVAPNASNSTSLSLDLDNMEEAPMDASASEEISLPSGDDLDYPDMGGGDEEQEVSPSALDLEFPDMEEHRSAPSDDLMQDSIKFDSPAAEVEIEVEQVEVQQMMAKPKAKKPTEKAPNKFMVNNMEEYEGSSEMREAADFMEKMELKIEKKKAAPSGANDRVWIFAGVVILLGLVGTLYFYHANIKTFIMKQITPSIIEDANAQTLKASPKKKVFFQLRT